MGGRKRVEVPAALLRLEKRFLAWRRTRPVGQRIPDSLWEAAAKLAVDHGLNRTAKRLKLDYYSLQKQVEQHRADSRSPVTFVELPTASMASAGASSSSECLIELDDGRGARLRVHLKGSEIPDLLALARLVLGRGGKAE